MPFLNQLAEGVSDFTCLVELRLVRQIDLVTYFPFIDHSRRLCINLIEICSGFWSFNFLFTFSFFLKTKRTINDNNFIALTHLLNYISFQNVLPFLYFIYKFAYCLLFLCSGKNSKSEMPGGTIITIISNHLHFPPTTQIMQQEK